MKKTNLLALCLVGLLASSATADTRKDEAWVKSIALQVWDDRQAARLDADGATAVVRHIPDGSLVTGVDFRLGKGVSISPNPHSLVGHWPREAVFTLKRKGRERPLRVVLGNYVPREEQVGGKWKLVWSDEFGGAEPDWNVWSKVPRNRANWGDDMTSDDRLFAMGDGVLTLKGMANTFLPADTAKFLTGGLWGKNKRTFMLGRIDIRARFSSAKGFWPALWLLPAADSKINSENGEIDIVEHLNYDHFVYQTVHSQYTNEVNKTNPKNYATPAIDREAFNVYSVEVYPDSLVFSVNGGASSFTYPRLSAEGPLQFPFDRFDYYVVLSAQLGGNWVGRVQLAPDEVVTMDVDYVRYYRLR